MPALQMIIEAFVQLAVFAVFCSFFWFGHKVISGRRQQTPVPLLKWLGIIKPSGSLKDGMMIVAGLIFFNQLMIWVEAPLGLDSLGGIEEGSPGARAAAMPTAIGAVMAALAYAFVMTGGAEELVMRGLLYKRFVSWFGYFKANILQSFLFAILHNLIVHLGVEDAPLAMHLLIFIKLFVFSYVLGWYMEKRDGGSIFMPWMAHGFLNFKTFLVYWLA